MTHWHRDGDNWTAVIAGHAAKISVSQAVNGRPYSRYIEIDSVYLTTRRTLKEAKARAEEACLFLEERLRLAREQLSQKNETTP